MRLSARMIATAAFAVFLMPTFLFHAGAAAAQVSTATPYSSARTTARPRRNCLWAIRICAPCRRRPTETGWCGSMAAARPSPITSLATWAWLATLAALMDSQLLLTGQAPRPNSSGTVYTYLFGPRYSFRNYERFTPFVQALFGGIHASDVTLSSGCMGAGCTPLPAENSFGLDRWRRIGLQSAPSSCHPHHSSRIPDDQVPGLLHRNNFVAE